MAESIFYDMVHHAGLESQFEVDSAGIGAWHVGDMPDHRTQKVLIENGLSPRGPARQIATSDLHRFHHIIPMDRANVLGLRSLRGLPEDEFNQKVKLMLDWSVNPAQREVPDPYTGTIDDFRRVFEMLVPACEYLLAHVR